MEKSLPIQFKAMPLQRSLRLAVSCSFSAASLAKGELGSATRSRSRGEALEANGRCEGPPLSPRPPLSRPLRSRSPRSPLPPNLLSRRPLSRSRSLPRFSAPRPSDPRPSLAFEALARAILVVVAAGRAFGCRWCRGRRGGRCSGLGRCAFAGLVAKILQILVAVAPSLAVPLALVAFTGLAGRGGPRALLRRLLVPLSVVA